MLGERLRLWKFGHPTAGRTELLGSLRSGVERAGHQRRRLLGLSRRQVLRVHERQLALDGV
jgi:hypothetical protein